MELGAFFLLLALLTMVSMYLYAPFMSHKRRVSVNESHEVSSLMAERDRVINALQELDFDFKLGKIPAEDYPGQRTLLLQKGAAILKELDELTERPAAIGAEDRIEKAVAARRADAAAEAAGLSDDEIESMIAARRKAHKKKSAGFCPRCGKPVLASDRFCPSCGKSLQ